VWVFGDGGSKEWVCEGGGVGGTAGCANVCVSIGTASESAWVA
jgi:hypothetical protein